MRSDIDPGAIYVAAAAHGLIILGIKFQGLGKIPYGVSPVSALDIYKTADVKGLGIFRSKFNGLAQVA
jgi:hypothetical protein